MNKTKKLVIAAAVLPMMFATASAYAFGGKGGHGGHGMDRGDFGGKCGGMDRGMFRDLDLTDEQKDQFRDLKDAKRDQMRSKFSENAADWQAEMQAYQTQVQDLVLAADFDQQKAELLAKTMVEKQTERKVQMLQARHEMLSILTDEQKAKLKTLQQERMGECSERMQRKMDKFSGANSN
ncbi:CpxP family protein [Vibrio sp. SCSIO 43137]|uniref:CpxP family protein n=1 Tax=Vibrio sp. SCSIO 43137 TaxID=3021011 RepID=UPI002307D8BD|nr:CpxP family protein [Vibrio sp. SCSIO 43137]WCE29531.1 CpxP family protein [Vibrio sp. SCSIO 43137]